MNFELINGEIEDIKDVRDYRNHSDGVMNCWYQDLKSRRWKKEREREKGKEGRGRGEIKEKKESRDTSQRIESIN